MSDTFSYSRIDVYEQCGFKYKLCYVDGKRFYTDSLATELGTLVHETEETIANYIKDGQPIDYTTLKNKFIAKMFELQLKYKDDFNSLDKSDRTYSQKCFYYLEEGIYRLEKYFKEHPTHIVIGTEIPFEFEYEKYTFKGFIDRVFYDTTLDLFIIQDIKTYAVPLENTKLSAPLQFVIYTLACQKLFNIDDPLKFKCQYDLPFCDLTQSAGVGDYLIRGKNKLNKLFDGIEKEDFEPNPSPLCHWCDYCPTNPKQPAEAKGLCPYHSLWTKENKSKAKAMPWLGLAEHESVVAKYKAKFIENEKKLF
jgi:putative RecB family exonuclease